jgi:superfamily II DNA or RNA helicase
MQDDLSDLQIASNGDYTDKSLNKHFRRSSLYSGVIEEYKKRTPGKKAIVFNCNIEHSVEMTAAFNSAGIISECVTSETKKEDRKRILQAFKDGYIKVLNNCGVLTTGYDEPSIEVVIMNRATKSLPLWLQCCGRGSRIYRNKPFFTVLDFGMNHNEHGLWSEPRTWSIEPPKKKKNIQKESPVKTCEKCDAMLPAVTKQCSFCGFIFPVNEDKLKEGVMVEIKSRIPSGLEGKKISDLTLDELFELQKSKRYKPTYVWRVVRSKGEDSIKEYASKNGYKKGWINNQLEQLQNNEKNVFTNYTLK